MAMTQYLRRMRLSMLKALEEMCNLATSETYSFLHIKLSAKMPGEMFCLRFHSRLVSRHKVADLKGEVSGD